MTFSPITVLSLSCFLFSATTLKTNEGIGDLLKNSTELQKIRASEPRSNNLNDTKLGYPSQTEGLPSQDAAARLSSLGNSEMLVKAPTNANILAKLGANPWKKYASIDAIGRATGGLLDNFVVCYWGCVLLMCAMTAFQMANYPDVDGLFSAEAKPEMRRSSLIEGKPGLMTRELEHDFWSFCLVTSYGQAHDWKGRKAKPVPWHFIAFAMGTVQLFMLGLILHDLNPLATPWTTKPSAPWLETGSSVNCMKFFMILFQMLPVTIEASGACKNFMSAVCIDPERISGPTCFPMIIACFHYVVTLGTVLGAVSVVLSCQQTPSVLYNSLAILFVTQFDETMFKFFNEILGLHVDWEVPVSIQAADAGMQWKEKFLRHMMVGFPLMWAFSILGRAWYTNMMPVSGILGAQIIRAIV